MKAIISIPVHEQPDVILDQIANINRFFPEADIVLHVSKGYFEKYELSPISGIAGVYLNPEHLETQWGNILPPHLSNFKFVETLDRAYDYFVFHSSNDLYVQYGVAEYIQQYDAGFNLHFLPQKYTYWWPSAQAWEDSGLKACMKAVGQTQIVASQIEGSFYKMEIIRKVMHTIQQNVDAGNVSLDSDGISRAREETFFSSLAECMVPREKIGRPFVFSEVHRFDRELWTAFQKLDAQYNKWMHFILPKKVYNKLKSIYNDAKFKRGKYETTPDIVDKVRNRDVDYIEKNRFLNDGVTTYELYRDASSLFAVKRVKREYNDPLRKYIRSLAEQQGTI